MHRSLACVRREPGERASGTCSPCTAAPAPLAYSCIATAALPSYRQQACPPQRLQTLPSAFGLLLQRSLACVRREPGERALERAARALHGLPAPLGTLHRLQTLPRGCKPFPAPLAFKLPRASNPSQRLWPTPASQPCLRQAGAWGESLWNDVRHRSCPCSSPQRLWPTPASQPCLASASGGSLGREPLERASQPCLRQAGAWGESLWNVQPVHCSPSAFGLLLHRNRSLALLSAAGLPSAAPANPSQRLWPTPAAQPCLRQAGAWGESPGTCSPCSYGLPKATLGILHRLQTLPRGCKPFPAPCPPPRLQTLPSAFGLLLHRSLACVRREPGERASGTCSPCTAAPAPLAYSCIATAALPSYRQQACPPQRLQTLPSAFGLLLHRSLALFLFSAARRPASSLLMGFQKRR